MFPLKVIYLTTSELLCTNILHLIVQRLWYREQFYSGQQYPHSSLYQFNVIGQEIGTMAMHTPRTSL